MSQTNTADMLASDKMVPDKVADVLIVGAGQAGGRLALHLAGLGFQGRVVLAGDDPHLPYERPPLSKAVLKGEAGEDSLFLTPADDWAKAGIETILGDQVVSIDYGLRVAGFASGAVLAFGSLVLATGGGPRQLPVPGGELCVGLRTLDDSRRLRATLEGASRVAIIGGGVIGLEVAATAAGLGKAVTVIEAGARVMARILPPVVSDWLTAAHRNAGVDLRLNTQVRGVRGDGAGYLVDTDGGEIAADVVVSAVGMTLNTGLAPLSAIGPSGGILTDEIGRVPGLERVYACGDVAESWNPLYGRNLRLETWRNADKQGRAIAQAIAGQASAYSETPWMWTDQYDRNIQVVGLWQDGAAVVARGECGARGSSLFWLVDGAVVGGVLIDNGRDRRFLEKMVEQRSKPSPAALADPAVPLKSLA